MGSSTHGDHLLGSSYIIHLKSELSRHGGAFARLGVLLALGLVLIQSLLVHIAGKPTPLANEWVCFLEVDLFLGGTIFGTGLIRNGASLRAQHGEAMGACVMFVEAILPQTVVTGFRSKDKAGVAMDFVVFLDFLLFLFMGLLRGVRLTGLFQQDGLARLGIGTQTEHEIFRGLNQFSPGFDTGDLESSF